MENPGIRRGSCDAGNGLQSTVHKEENLQMAERYWKNEPNPSGEPPIPEFLVSGDIEIVEIIQEF